jgi:hypothetical protein
MAGTLIVNITIVVPDTYPDFVATVFLELGARMARFFMLYTTVCAHG